jgi:hypothetical protein
MTLGLPARKPRAAAIAIDESAHVSRHPCVFTTELTESTEGMRRKQFFQHYKIAFLRIPSVYSVPSVVNTRL